MAGRRTASQIASASAASFLLRLTYGRVERNAGLPAERRIEFRIGIHLGDVVERATAPQKVASRFGA
jgi:class 3 adenylate cyclase